MASEFDPAYVQEASEGRRTTSTILSLTTGTGYSVYKSTIIPAIERAEREVILVTCFWAASATRDLVNEALVHLSEKGLSSSKKISVQICFSSASLARNMLLPTPKEGQHYPSSSWKKIGLPRPEELKGLNMRVSRKFFWPFGIIHSKYVVVDRELAIFPSCNVSWERWFEAAVSCRGSVVGHLLSFHGLFWDDELSLAAASEGAAEDGAHEPTATSPGTGGGSNSTPNNVIPAPTTLLPSPHTPSLLPNHLQLQTLASHCPCLPATTSTPAFHPTPLLRTTFHLLATAKSRIILLTPNLTEPTVVDLLLQALARGVSVRIWTNRTLMTMEQLVTAGTTTPASIQRLRRRAEQMENDGRLEVSYFDSDDGPGTQHPVLREIEQYRDTVPVKLHAKVTIVDGEKILLGSGNMDAASWKTSQELGIMIESPAVVDEFMKLWKYDKLGV
ncbi:Phospholipase D/Transphosphatidylase [Cladophialophora carrionii]|uniref:Phospholipase D/Transphosphatidylase n=1 Tax=Cladophialophora carrionii TaxID=86049 RepID=A0A1C1CEY8_9EURO|nr:Phospholipase D/Transphosphatidylase [Cladophialophora carrionii]